jgi:integrase
LSPSDLEGDTLHIDKAKVPDEHGQYVIKTTKTTDSTGDVRIPEDVAEKIREQGFVYDGDPQMLTKTLHKMQDRLGIPRFSVHKLRHFFASYMHAKGFTNKQIQAGGRWKTDHVMKEIYQHAMDMDSAKKRMADSIGGLL